MSWLRLDEGHKKHRVALARDKRGGVWVSYPGGAILVQPERHAVAAGKADEGVRAPMTGKVVQVKAEVGVRVEAGALLVVLEAMKMEYRLTAPKAGVIESVACKAGELVDLGAVLVTLGE